MLRRLARRTKAFYRAASASLAWRLVLGAAAVLGYVKGEERPTGFVTLAAGGLAGTGECVAWTAGEQERFAEACPALVPTGGTTIGALHASLPRNLYRVEGKKTAAYEIAEGLGWKAPDRVVCPTAGGTMALAMDQGFRELLALGWIDRMPAIDIVQPEGCAPVARAVRTGKKVEPWGEVRTRSAGLTSPNPGAGNRVADIVRKTEGQAVIVSDDLNIEAEFLIARREGLFLQPASGASVASLMPGADRPRPVHPEETIVCIGTGTGKNATEVASAALGPTVRIKPELGAFIGAWNERKGK